MKYVLILGGVISGIGKGVIASSTGLLLKTLGLKVTAIKIDPYINVDAGTMNPIEHGKFSHLFFSALVWALCIVSTLNRYETGKRCDS